MNFTGPPANSFSIGRINGGEAYFNKNLDGCKKDINELYNTFKIMGYEPKLLNGNELEIQIDKDHCTIAFCV